MAKRRHDKLSMASRVVSITFSLRQRMSLSKVVLGMQSFRCSEVVLSLSLHIKALLGGLYGVEYTQIGYSGGKKLHPTYRRIGDHTEVVEVHYNPKLISISDILQVFSRTMITRHSFPLDIGRLFSTRRTFRRTKPSISSGTFSLCWWIEVTGSLTRR